MHSKSPETRDDASPRLLAGAWALLAVQVVLTGLASAHMFLSVLSIASCTETSCDYAAFDTFNKIFAIGVIVLLIGAAVGIRLLRHRPSVAIWVPVLAILLTATLLVVTYSLSRAALNLPLFGGRGD